MTPGKFAKAVGIPWGEFVPLLDNRPPTQDEDAAWILINEYVNNRLGLLMAVRHELNVNLQTTRARRAVRLQRVRALGSSLPTREDR